MANLNKAPTTNNPDDWWKHYNNKAQGYMGQIEEREPFSFDVNSDPLYEQLKDQYIQQGQMAMMDTMGQAAAMTGGYGNSYAQTVGQQAYNQYIGQLNDAVPELYGMAYDKYAQEGQDLYDKYQLYAGARDAVKADMDTEKSSLVNLIAAGYKPTDAELQAAGMTRDQANSYATAATTSKASETKYTVLDYEEQKKWEKDFDKAESLDDIDRIADRMEQAGVDPQIVASWRDSYAEKFKDKDSGDAVVPPIVTKLPYKPGRVGNWDTEMRLR